MVSFTLGARAGKGDAPWTPLASVPKTVPYSSGRLCSHSLPGLPFPALSPPRLVFPPQFLSPCQAWLRSRFGQAAQRHWCPQSCRQGPYPTSHGRSSGQHQRCARGHAGIWKPPRTAGQEKGGRAPGTTGARRGLRPGGCHRQKWTPTHTAPTRATAAAAEISVVPWLPWRDPVAGSPRGLGPGAGTGGSARREQGCGNIGDERQEVPGQRGLHGWQGA